METKDYMYIDVRQCVRCGEDHNHLLFKKLRNPQDEYSWFGMCASSDQPILLKIIITK